MKISSLDDVQQAQRQNRWLTRPPVDDVIVDIDIDIDDDERMVLQSRLENLFNDCGCIWGPPAFVACFVGLWVPEWLHVGFSGQWLLFSLLASATAAASAKFVALYVSHVRLNHELRLLRERLLLEGFRYKLK